MNSSRIRVKMCGMTRNEDVDHAVFLGVDAIGLIFYPKSSRFVSVEKAKTLLKNLPPFVDAVAVLVNPEKDTVTQIINELPINILQFHGDESPDFCQQFNRPFVKSIHPKTGEHIHQMTDKYTKAQALLLDTASTTSRGGTGLSFDWRIIPLNLSKPYILAGGLNELNVLYAVRIGKPYAVDVCSGIEISPGVKDHKKMNQFIKVLWGKMNKKELPDEQGHFGPYGGIFVADTLMFALKQLDEAYTQYRNDPDFLAELHLELKDYVGRPNPLYHAKRLSKELGGAQIYLKREDLNHTGAHKINNTVGQALLAKRMGKTRIIAETGAGQHGVASATVAAKLGFECVVYMGSEDIKRQSSNVYRMKLLGATVIPVTSGSKTLKDALNEAMRDWVSHVDDTFYIIGTVAGPHPYPQMVRDFQTIIGIEARAQCLDKTGQLPDALVACVGGGSNAIGLFHPFLNDPSVAIYGIEAGGKGLDTGEHSASLIKGKPGVLHGNRTYVLCDEFGQIKDTHSISAGLDYPGVGPEHAYLKDTGRVEYMAINDVEALNAFRTLTRVEGIIPALESSHAVAYAMKLAKTMDVKQTIIVNLSGRGDKDMHTVATIDGITL